MLNRLFLLQKRAIRVSNSSYLAHTDPLFTKYRSLKLNDIYSFPLGTVMFQLAHNCLPSCLASMFTLNQSIHTHCTRQASHYHTLFTRTLLSHNSIKYQGPKLWNNSINTKVLNSGTIVLNTKVLNSGTL